jgi:hypothetical protein
MAEEHIDHIKELQNKLYSRDPKQIPQDKYGILRPVRQKVESTWGETIVPRQPRKRLSAGYKTFFIFSVLFFLVGAGVAYFSIYRGAVTISSKNVDIAILGNSFISAGSSLPISVSIANKNSSDLLNTTLTISYPKGADDGPQAEVVRSSVSLGTIGSAKTKSQPFAPVLYGEQGATRTITATLQYQLAGSTAQFLKTSTFAVVINASPLNLTVDMPSSVSSNQPITIASHIVFTGDEVLKNGLVRIEYPSGFVYESSVPKPVAGNNIWSLGDLVKDSTADVVVQGRLLGEKGDEKAFRIYAGIAHTAGSSDISVAYNSVLKTTTLEDPFLNASIKIGDTTADNVTLEKGKQIKGTVSWQNNAAVALTNPLLTMSLDGVAIDPSTVEVPDGSYDEVSRTIVWSGETNADFVAIAPGQSGEFTFSFTPKESLDSSTLALALSVSANPADSDTPFSVGTIDKKLISFATAIQFAAQSLWSIGPIKNTGPYPARANKETTYTITWTIKPSSHPLSNVVATAKLPDGISYTGVVMPQAEQVRFDPDSRMVTWMIGNMPKQTNLNNFKTVSFQISARPSKSQIGNPLALLGQTIISGTDAVVNAPINSSRPSLSTRLDTDPAYSTDAEKVLP